jgi:hypothetical protein
MVFFGGGGRILLFSSVNLTNFSFSLDFFFQVSDMKKLKEKKPLTSDIL